MGDFRDARSMVEIFIGHWMCVVCWFTLGCGFVLCPIVPDFVPDGVSYLIGGG